MTVIGYQDDKLSAPDLVTQAQSVRAGWVRIITTTKGDPAEVRERINAAHAAGLQVLLTVGGTGTTELEPGVTATLRLIKRLPRADAYTWTNEPDLTGRTPANYARGWMKLRRVLGHRLLWGDFSPHRPVSYTLEAAKAVKLPRDLDFAIHPYTTGDPLAPEANPGWAEGAMGDLGKSRRTLEKAGLHPTWWFTEFGFRPENARYWPHAVQRAQQLGARMLVAYDVQGPTWDTKLDASARAYLGGR